MDGVENIRSHVMLPDGCGAGHLFLLSLPTGCQDLFLPEALADRLELLEVRGEGARLALERSDAVLDLLQARGHDCCSILSTTTSLEDLKMFQSNSSRQLRSMT